MSVIERAVERCPFNPTESIGDYQKRDHAELGYLLGQVQHELEEFERDGHASDLEAAHKAFRAFQVDLEQHITSEEDDIYPRWTVKHPGDQARIQHFLEEHVEIRRLTAWLGDELKRGQPVRALVALEKLFATVRDHEHDEEALWPPGAGWLFQRAHEGREAPQVPVERLARKAAARWSEPYFDDPGASEAVVSFLLDADGHETDFYVRWYGTLEGPRVNPRTGKPYPEPYQSVSTDDGVLDDHDTLAEAKKAVLKAARKSGSIERLPRGVERLPASVSPEERALYDRIADDSDELLALLWDEPLGTNGLQAFAKRYGVRLLGRGISRVVFEVPSGALKIEPDPVPYGQNENEARIWNEAPPSIRRFLVPVLAASDDGRWLLMEKVQAGRPPSNERLAEMSEVLAACGLPDVSDDNTTTDGRVLDYGYLLDGWEPWEACVTRATESLPVAGIAAGLAARAVARRAMRKTERLPRGGARQIETWYDLVLHRNVLHTPDGPIELKPLGKGQFTRAFTRVDQPNRVILISDEGAYEKEALALAHEEDPRNPHIPAVVKLGSTVDDRTVYEMPKYKAPLRKADSPEGWRDYMALKKCREAAFDELRQRRGYGWAWWHDGYAINDATVDCGEGKVREPVLDALRTIKDNVANYGATYTSEFAPRNLATDDAGNLVLLDIMFDGEAMQKRLRGGRHERLPKVERLAFGEPADVACPPTKGYAHARSFESRTAAHRDAEVRGLMVKHKVAAWEKLAKQAAPLLAEYGYPIDLSEPLGCGMFACAYSVQGRDDVIVKLTGDSSEAAAWEQVIEQADPNSDEWPEGLARTFCVKALPFEIPLGKPPLRSRDSVDRAEHEAWDRVRRRGNERHLFFIVQERMKPLGRKASILFTDNAYDIRTTAGEERDTIKPLTTARLNHMLDELVTTFDEQAGPGTGRALRDVVEAIRWLREDVGIRFTDVHGKNVMQRIGGDLSFAISDIGYSVGPSVDVGKIAPAAAVERLSVIERAEVSDDVDIGPAEPEECGTEPPPNDSLTLGWIARAANKKTGPIPTAYVIEVDVDVNDPAAGSRASCAAIACSLLDKGCYAHSGTPRMGIASMVKAISKGADRSLEEALKNRHPDAKTTRMTALGDAGGTPLLVALALKAAVRIHKEGLGLIGYTHGWRVKHAEPLKAAFRASCNDLTEVDEALAAGWKATVVLPGDTDPKSKGLRTPGGARVLICPALVPPAPGRERVTCNKCRLCHVEAAPQVIGFPAHGSQQKAATKIARRAIADGQLVALVPQGPQGAQLTSRDGRAQSRVRPIERLSHAEARITGSRIQSLVFDREDFDVPSAKMWAREHGFRYGKVDVTENTIRLRQRDPGDFLPNTWGTITLRPGVQATVAVPVDHPNARKD